VTGEDTCGEAVDTGLLGKFVYGRVSKFIPLVGIELTAERREEGEGGIVRGWWWCMRSEPRGNPG